MRKASKVLLGVAASGASLCLAAPAGAQVDANPPLPNVLLLIDTSGSMENMIDGQRPEKVGAKCIPGTATPMNRWATLLSVLTGTIQNFSCQEVDRSGAAFINEYTYDGAAPYDAYYHLPFHRVLSNKCTPGPGVTTPFWFDWPIGGIKYHPDSSTALPCLAPGWQQSPDGILDTFAERARFGLMTFDSHPDPGTGLSGAVKNGASGMKGTWSYYPGWNVAGTPASGNPPSCSVQPFEVGARNPSAPPWEGRLIPFGIYDAPLLDVKATNAQVQEALISMRPYGATPLAGMLQDARDFLLLDNLPNPVTPTLEYGPAADKFYNGGCRKTFIIVLSDGEPNLDLRPKCKEQGNPNGKCPYREPWEVASELWTLPDPEKRITTFAVGFGLSTVGADDCSLLTPADVTAPGGKCATATGPLKACCTLAHIAIAGGSQKAFFANNPGQLKSALSQVLAQISAGSTSRTIPSFAAATTTTANDPSAKAPASAYQFVSSFDAKAAGGLWTGNLERKRYACKPDANAGGALTPQLQDVEPALGDDFEANVNTAPSQRKFFTAVGESAGPLIHSGRSIRPFTAADDGLGIYKTQSHAANAPQTAAQFASSVPNVALSIPTVGPPPDCVSRLSAADGASCANKLLRWNVGEPNAGLVETRVGNVLGSIYHSTPVAVGTPREFLRDESYSSFALQQAKRPLMLYTATTDGQLHAFKVASNDPTDTLKVDGLANNELWSFMPPQVLPRLLGAYDQQALLLDGQPIVKDVIFRRTKNQATAGYGAGGASWKTVLVGAGGPGGGYYYALDITDPTAPAFLWQLSTDVNGSPLFGDTTPSPAIATVAVKNAGGDVEEVAVAILAGGSTKVKQLLSCPRNAAYSGFGNEPPRTSVRCWGAPASLTPGPARSLTIVELATGKVLRNFRFAVTDGPPGLPFTQTAFDSPLTGVPVAYPSQPGQVANRVYVGDADGTLWRMDLSDPDPTKWTGTLAWDGYTGEGFDKGEPIQTPPIVSVDPFGSTVLLFSTGDQEVLTPSAAQKNYIWSLKETGTGNTLTTASNWKIPLVGGKRVTGPLSLFNSVLYFATYTPETSPTNACMQGYGSIWGVHFTNSCAKTPSTCQGGDPPSLPWPQFAVDPDDITAGFVREDVQDPGTIVFGAAVTQTPSCLNTEDYSDDYLGGRTAISEVTAGEFQLVFHTGQGGQSSNNSQTNTQTVRLPQPRESTRIDSWASIVE